MRESRVSAVCEAMYVVMLCMIVVRVGYAVKFRPSSFEAECDAVFAERKAPIVCLRADGNCAERETQICHTCSRSRPTRWSKENNVAKSIDSMCDNDVTYCGVDKMTESSGPCEDDERYTVKAFLKLNKRFQYTGDNEYLAMSTDKDTGVPRWVAFRVKGSLWEKKEDGKLLQVQRSHFRNDPDGESYWLGSTDYGETKYVRGHVAFNQIFKYSEVTEVASNFYTNIAPQLGRINHPIWYQGAEQVIFGRVTENPEWEYYFVSGVAGGLGNDNSACMRVEAYPDEASLPERIRSSVPAYFWIAFVALDDSLNIRDQGGFSVKNSNDETTKVISYATFGDVETFLRQCCGDACRVDLFPGVGRDADARPSCASLSRVGSCDLVPELESCEEFCVRSSFWRSNSVVCRTARRGRGCSRGAGEEFTCRDTCESREDSPQSCTDLHFVRKCSSLGRDEGLCKSACTDHGVFFSGSFGNWRDHRCMFKDGRCRNGDRKGSDGIYRASRQCSDGCERRSEASPSLKIMDITNTKGKDALLKLCAARGLFGFDERTTDENLRRALRIYEGIFKSTTYPFDGATIRKTESEGGVNKNVLVGHCTNFDLVDAPDECGRKSRGDLETLLERFVKYRLSETDFEQMTLAELRAAAKLRGLVVSNDAQILRSDLRAYDCYVEGPEQRYARCAHDAAHRALILGTSNPLVRFRRIARDEGALEPN